MKWKFAALISISMFLMGFYTAPVFQSDITRDGKTDMEDFAFLSKNWLKGVDMSLGFELVADPGFDLAVELSPWTFDGWEISGGMAIFSNQEAEGTLYQSVVVEIGKTYRISFDSITPPIVSIVSQMEETVISTVPIDLVSEETFLEIWFKDSNFRDAWVDNVSVREVFADGSLGIEMIMDEMDQ